MSRADGHVVGMARVLDHGPTELLLNIVVVSEGFREQELPQFAQYVQRFADNLLDTPPFSRFRCGFNVLRVDVASNERGADDPFECGGTGYRRATFFDASFCAFGIRRGISMNDGDVISTVQQFIPRWHAIIALVNSTNRG